MRLRRMLWAGAALFVAISASCIATVAFSAPGLETPSMAARLWTVSTLQADGKTKCEIMMSGHTRDAGGAYTIHMISDTVNPYIIIEHDGDDIAAREASFVINGNFKLMSLDILQQNYDKQRRGIYMQMPREAFVKGVLGQLDFPESDFIDIKVGKRSFGAVVQGFTTITDKLHECEESLNEKPTQAPMLPSQPK